LRNGAIVGGLTGAAIVAALATIRYRRRKSS
jgi:MYXO-CTERM domain-containing protein